MAVEYGVEYNLYAYLATELPELNYAVNGYNSESPEECIMLMGNPGEPAHWYDRTDWQIQINSRASGRVKAGKNANKVYQKLKDRFGLELPAYTLEGDELPAFIAWQIVPIQSPGYIGADEAGREMFSFNISLTTK